MMRKDELHALAAPGVAQKIAAIEEELSRYHLEWPELFLSVTPPALLKPTLKNGNGHQPAPAVAALVKRDGQQAAAVRARRAATAKLLDVLQAQGPLTVAGWQAAVGRKVPFGTLLNNGYVKRIGEKYHRTKKPFPAEKPHSRTRSSSGLT